MRKKSFVLWLLLALFAFAVMAGGGGCGGGDNDDTPAGNYEFSDLEGTWTLVAGTGKGNLKGVYDGLQVSGTATGISGIATIANILVLPDGKAADADIKMESSWRVTGSASGYGNIDGIVPVNFEHKKGTYTAGITMEKRASNVFFYEYNETGYHEDMTITFKSSTTADVKQTTTINQSGVSEALTVTYSVQK